MHALQPHDSARQVLLPPPPLTLDPLQCLVDRARAGDSSAVAQLYERLAPRIARYIARHFGGCPETVEDLTSEVFVKALARLNRYESRGRPFSAWLYRIAHNHLIDHRRTRPRDLLGPPGWEQLPEPAAEQTLERALDRQELAGALAQLPMDYRRVIALRFLEARSIAETAAATGKSQDAVKKAQARALARLRAILAPARPGRG